MGKEAKDNATSEKQPALHSDTDIPDAPSIINCREER
jgi:hypothetical protein